MDREDLEEAAKTTARLGWDLVMIALALFSVAMIFWFDRANATQQRWLIQLDFGIVALFAIDWAWGYRKATNKKQFVKRNWIDLLGMVPLYFTTFGFLRLLRMVRILRIIRLFRATAGFIERTERIAKRSNLGRIGLISAVITLVGALLVWVAERNVNPSYENFGDTLWWALVTVTTVGYGDIAPITTLGRALAGILMIVGIGIIAGLASQVSVALLRHEEDAAPGAGLDGALERIAALHAAGQLTDEEFEKAKGKLLD